MTYMIKICQFCGEEFETTSGTKKFCDRIHTKICVVCGKEFIIPNSRLGEKDLRSTCSRKCTSELRKQTCMKKYGGPAPASSPEVRKKMEQTTKERYGVLHAAQSPEILDKIKSTNLERYGKSFYVHTDEYKDRLKETSLDKYGTEYPIQSEVVKNKIKSTNLERYGVECVFASKDIRKKAQETYYNKTGYFEPWSNPDVIHKAEQTNLERYGVRRPMQGQLAKDKFAQTSLERYGTSNPMQSEEIQARIRKTNLERYGSECYLSSEECKTKLNDAMQSKYGVSYYSESESYRLKSMLDPSKIDEFNRFKQNPSEYISRYESSPSLRQLSNDLGISDTTAGQHVYKFGLEDKIKLVYSYMEDGVYQFIHNLDPTIHIERNTKKYITPKELDLYLPEFKIGIECNPTATHNSTVSIFNADPIKYDYHRLKSEECMKKEIFLFHIFGYEWTHKREIIESMIRNLLNRCEHKIYARKTTVRLVDSTVSRNFLNTNHRQGASTSSVNLGLYYNDELVSLMTFGKMRTSIGTSSNEDLTDCWELVRFCSKLNTSVVGGASKLFKHFIDNYHPVRIRSFSDIAHTRGRLYDTLGFKCIRTSEPGYVWVNTKTDVAYHRMNAQKQNIKKFLHDDSIDLSKSEREIMESHGFVRVFDSGVDVWEWNR